MKIQPFDFADTCQYFKNFSDEDKAMIYGIVGGTPQYLLQMDDGLSVEENIKNTFLNPISSLFEEPENLLKQEVREPALYNAVITAIATGASRMAEISTKVGEDTSICSAYLKNLINLGKRRHTAKKPLESQFIQLMTICSGSGFGLYRKTVLLSHAAPQIWRTSGSNPICRIIWGKFLKKSVSSTSGGFC